MPTVTQAIQFYLQQLKSTHSSPELLDRWSPEMETQVTVAQGKGEPVDGKRSTYTNGCDEWFNVRIPKRAATEPEFNDYELRWIIEDHADAIGCSGWNWAKRTSLYVGYDFDAITGHAKGIGVSEDELAAVKAAACQVPWVEVRRSTRGAGLHLYVHVDNIPTANHTEHAALARAILGQLSLAADFDFTTSIDACGGILWIWNRKMTRDGFTLVKAATEKCPEPAGWRDHIDVAQRKTPRVRIELGDSELGQKRFPISDTHRKIVETHAALGYTTIWNPDHWCWHLHPHGLKLVHQKLKLTGYYDTLSEGNDPATPAVYAYPKAHGGLYVIRFGEGATEHPLWGKTRHGKPAILFNASLTPRAVAQAVGATLTKHGFACRTYDTAKQAAQYLGVQLHPITDRMIEFDFRNGLLTFKAERAGKNDLPKDWVANSRSLTYSVELEPREDCASESDYDDRFRHLITMEGRNAGWIVARGNRWGAEPKENVANVAYAHYQEAGTLALSWAIENPWTLDPQPFQPTILSGRRYNPNAAQLITAAPGEHPTFDRVLAHLGQGLDDACKDEDWCQLHHIDGKRYLLLWAAYMVQCPRQRLPYLFFYSARQNQGKSTFGRALEKLFVNGHGVVDPHSAFVEKFNAKLEGAVLCNMSEKHVPRNKMGDLKMLIEEPWLDIRKMQTDAYKSPNYTHWVHTSNLLDSLPLDRHDTRHMCIEVPYLISEVPWSDLELQLEREAPAFLFSLLDAELPAIAGRLALPILWTDLKREMTETVQDERVDALVDRMAKCVDHFNASYRDPSGECMPVPYSPTEVIEILGEGPWGSHPQHFTSFLRRAVRPLQRKGIQVAICDPDPHSKRVPIIIERGPDPDELPRPIEFMT